jgi:hypothetical protein
MNRVTAIICGALLFGLGLFLGMVGSFVRTLSPETPATTQASARDTANPPPGAAQSKRGPARRPVSNAELALSEALAMVAVALASPPVASPPPARYSPPATSAPPARVEIVNISTNTPEPPSLDTLMADTADGAPSANPQAAALQLPPPPPLSTPSPLPPPPRLPPSNPLAGQWVYDPQLGWLWLSESTSSVVIVPMIEIFPGGLITLNATPKPNKARKWTAGASKFPPDQKPKNGVTPHTASDVKPSSAPPSFAGKK